MERNVLDHTSGNMRCSKLDFLVTLSCKKDGNGKKWGQKFVNHKAVQIRVLDYTSDNEKIAGYGVTSW
jgi:hypothetical protein